MCKKSKVAQLPQILLGLLFIVAGAMKLFMIGPVNFAGMISMAFGFIGLTGTLALVVAWVIAITEVLGGFALLMQKWVPKKLFKLLIGILIIVLAGAIVFIHVRSGDIMSALKDLIILSLLVVAYKQQGCCTNKACDTSDCCADEDCTDGTCKA